MSAKPNEQTLFADAARGAVQKVGWDPRYDLEIVTPRSPGGRAVRYGWRAERVRLEYVPGLLAYVSRAAALAGTASCRNAVEAFRHVVQSRVYLQAGSFKVCPYSADDYAEILEATADGLRSAGAGEADVQRHMVTTTSLFITAVVCGTYAIRGPDPEALRRGWALDQIARSLASDAALSPAAAVCAGVQLRLWADVSGIADAIRSRFPASFDVLDFEVDRGTAILLDTFAHTGGPPGLAWSDPSLAEEILDELMYHFRSWPIKASQWAEMLAPYVCDEEIVPPPGRPPSGPLPRTGRPSDEARPRMRGMPDRGQVAPRQILERMHADNQATPGTPDDPFGRRFLSDAAFRRRVIQSGIGRGKNPMDFHLPYDALDAFYRNRTADVQVQSETAQRPGMAMEIAFMAREEVGSATPNFSRIDWGATRFDPSGKVRLYQKAVPVLDEAPVKTEMRGFPDLLLVVDSSGSMRWDPAQGKGPYDSLLRAVYSVFEFLERCGKARHMRFAAINFSAKTVGTPWCGGYHDLRKVKEALFAWQGGGTKLDCAALDRLAASSLDRFLCLMITDSQISNAKEVVPAIARMVSHGNPFILIQIGKDTPMAQDVRGLGVPVHVIPGPAQLQGLCLECARANYMK